jgi:ADP-ribose pyrophosphatase YjhB (NUDIX family)
MNPYPNIRIRAAGVLRRENRILFHRMKKCDGWVLPGGRVETGETSVEAVEREFREESGLRVRSLRPFCVIENFNAYEYDGLHEISIYHEMRADGDIPVSDAPFKGKDPTVELTFRWIPVDELDSHNIYPRALKDVLKELPDDVTHFINDDKDSEG